MQRAGAWGGKGTTLQSIIIQCRYVININAHGTNAKEHKLFVNSDRCPKKVEDIT